MNVAPRSQIRITRVQLQFFGCCTPASADGAHFRAVLFGVPPGTSFPSFQFNPEIREPQLEAVFETSTVDYPRAGGWLSDNSYAYLAHFLSAPLKEDYELLGEVRLSRLVGFQEYLSPVIDVRVMGRLILVVVSYSLHNNFTVRNLVGVRLEHSSLPT